MIDPIVPVGPPVVAEKPSAPSSEKSPDAFSSVLESAVRTVDAAQSRSEAAVEQFLRGEGQDLHSVLLEVQRAELAFELFVQVRNKVTQAYQEIMRMPL